MSVKRSSDFRPESFLGDAQSLPCFSRILSFSEIAFLTNSTIRCKLEQRSAGGSTYAGFSLCACPTYRGRFFICFFHLPQHHINTDNYGQFVCKAIKRFQTRAARGRPFLFAPVSQLQTFGSVYQRVFESHPKNKTYNQFRETQNFSANALFPQNMCSWLYLYSMLHLLRYYDLFA